MSAQLETDIRRGVITAAKRYRLEYLKVAPTDHGHRSPLNDARRHLFDLIEIMNELEAER